MSGLGRRGLLILALATVFAGALLAHFDIGGVFPPLVASLGLAVAMLLAWREPGAGDAPNFSSGPTARVGEAGRTRPPGD